MVASPDTCDLGKLRLKMNDTAIMQPWFCDRLHKYLRLYRRNELTIYEWDILFRKLNIGMSQITPTINFNNENVLLLSTILQFGKELDIDPLVLLGWNSQLDTRHYIDHDCTGIKETTSVYDRVFRNKATLNPPNPVFPENGA